MSEVKTITITPNYEALFEQFLNDAVLHMESLARTRKLPIQEQVHTRKEVYDFVASLRVALNAMTKIEQVYRLREQFNDAADKMYATITKEQDDAEYFEQA